MTCQKYTAKGDDAPSVGPAAVRPCTPHRTSCVPTPILVHLLHACPRRAGVDTNNDSQERKTQTRCMVRPSQDGETDRGGSVRNGDLRRPRFKYETSAVHDWPGLRLQAKEKEEQSG